MLISPAINYPPLPRYRFLRARSIDRGWQGAGNNVYRIPAFYLPVIGEHIILRRLIKESINFLHWTDKSFNLIHANWAYRSGAIAAAVAEYIDVPFVLTIWGSDIDIWLRERRKRQHILEVFSKTGALIVQNKAHRKKLMELGITAKKIFLNPLGIDTEKFTPAVNKCRNQKFTLGIIGNLFRDKGHHDVFRALAICTSDARLTIIGDGPELNNLRSLTHQLKINHRVKFVGMKPPQEIPALLQKIDALIIGSYHEGAPKVLLEALSCGKPVISTKVGFAPEIIEPDCGLLVDIGQIDAMAGAIDTAVLQKWCAQEIRSFALPYDWRFFKQRLRSIYEYVLKETK